MRVEIFIIEETENIFELCIALPSKLSELLSDHKTKCLEDINCIIQDLKKNITGVYHTSNIEYDGENIDDSSWFKYTFKCYNYDFLTFIKANKRLTFNNKTELEIIMSDKKVPYSLWSVTALKNECKARNFDTADYAEIEDKQILVELLKQDDSLKAGSDDDVLKAVGDDDVLEEEEEEEKPKKKVEKKKVEKKVEEPKKKKKVENKVNLNEELRSAGLWKKGCQFLSTQKKQQLLDCKDEKARKVIYDELDVINEGIKIKLSQKMKEKHAEKSSVSPAVVGCIYDGKTLVELQKIAIGRKEELKEKGLSPKKSDTVETLIEKLIKADSKKIS